MLKDKRHTDLKGATANMKGPIRVSFRKNKRYRLWDHVNLDFCKVGHCNGGYVVV